MQPACLHDRPEPASSAGRWLPQLNPQLFAPELFLTSPEMPLSAKCRTMPDQLNQGRELHWIAVLGHLLAVLATFGTLAGEPGSRGVV